MKNNKLETKTYAFKLSRKKLIRKQPGRLFLSFRHIFAIANAVYEEMLRESLNQVVIIGGESGAGKTESAKLLVHHLAAVNQSKTKLITEQVTHFCDVLFGFFLALCRQ